jgi:hypothetical protein
MQVRPMVPKLAVDVEVFFHQRPYFSKAS